MTSLEVSTRRYARADRHAVISVLCQAFADDPVLGWFLPERDGQHGRLNMFFDVTLRRDVLPHGEVHVAEHRGFVVGAALWRRPGELSSTGWRSLLDIPWWMMVFRSDLGRAGKGLDAMKAVHPHEPHWYLPTIGVSPDSQGLGVGSALLAGMLRRCDADQVPAYLESSKPGNIGFYERHGFAVVEQRHLPDGPPFWPMWRAPHP
jgi:ribosomal protein S18 acetylase RimI-like enzyme